MSADQLAQENAELRRQLEEYRQRELADLRQRLAKAEEDVTRYRAEADRNAQVGRQIAVEAQSTIAGLRSKLDSARRLENANVRPKS